MGVATVSGPCEELGADTECERRALSGPDRQPSFLLAWAVTAASYSSQKGCHDTLDFTGPSAPLARLRSKLQLIFALIQVCVVHASSEFATVRRLCGESCQ